MTTYYLPDLTGTSSDYLQVNIPAFVYQSGMKVSFENSPIFVSSLVITLTDGTARVLVRNVDWEVKTDDIDQTAMSRAFLENPAFTGTLVKSISMKSNVALNKSIAMTFQEFYLTQPGRFFDDGRPLEVTPDLIKSLITGLSDVRQQVARVQSPVALNLNPPTLLPFDLNCELSSNVITNEPIIINTVAGAKVVRLAQGAFFPNTLTLRYNGNVLNPATDYMPVVVSPLTGKTINPTGIYQYILLNGSFAGTITASYHAVGGEVQQNDIDSVYELMIAIKTFLDDGIFVTSETIVETPAFRAFSSRLNLLEDGMRRLLSGTPTYGDSSSNNAVTRPISAPNSDVHWWSIATLYKVQGSNDVITADQFKGRIYLPDSKISLGFNVDFNMDQLRNWVSFKTDSLVFDPLYSLFSDFSVAAPQWPAVRVVWNRSSMAFSGAVIQIGVPLPTLLDRMVVEDLSSAESCWVLSRHNEFILGGASVDPSVPDDSGFVLPDGVSVWSPASGISYSEICVPQYDPGYLAYLGSTHTLSDIITIEPTAGLFNITIPDYFPVRKIKTLLVTMMSADGNIVYDITIPLTGLTPTERSGRVTFVDSENEAFGLVTLVTQDEVGNISIALNGIEIAAPLITGTQSAKTDIVRYIRVRM